MKDRYLKITLHDNDFNWELQNVCRLLSMYLPNTKILESVQSQALKDLTTDSTTFNDSVLREMILDMLCMFHKLQNALKHNTKYSDRECVDIYHYFVEQLDISIVDKEDIPDSNNDEDFFIRISDYYINDLDWFFV